MGKDYKWEGKGGRMEKGEEESCLWGKGGSTVSDIIVKRYILTLQLLHLCIHKRGGGTAKHYIFEKTQKNHLHKQLYNHIVNSFSKTCKYFFFELFIDYEIGIFLACIWMSNISVSAMMPYLFLPSLMED